MNILPFAALGLLGGALFKAVTKKPSTPTAAVQPAPLPTVQRDDAVAAAEKQTALLRRRGGAADMVTGTYGAAAPGGGKTTLGS